MCDEDFEFIPDLLVTQEVYDKAVRKHPEVPDCLILSKICVETVRQDTWCLQEIPDHLKTTNVFRGSTQRFIIIRICLRPS